jgi:hypothetical protein
VKELKTHFTISKRYHYEVWQDIQILSGEEWEPEIDNALHGRHLGLLLVSPEFLASGFIRRVALSRFIGEPGESGKPALPVGLKPVELELSDHGGLARHQIFFDAEGKCFSERAANRRDAFVKALFARIEQRLDRAPEPAAPAEESLAPEPAALRRHRATDRYLAHTACPNPLPTKGRSASMPRDFEQTPGRPDAAPDR